MALRERELGLGGGTALDEAQRMAAGLPAPYETTSRLLAVASTPWKASGVSRARADELFALHRRIGQEGRAWRDQLESAGDADVASRYLRLSFECSNRMRLRDWGVERGPLVDPAPPILQFRDATCDGVDSERLDSILAEVPRFGEAHLFLGELTLREGRLVSTERHMQAALDAVPDLTAARLVLGQVYQAMEDFEAALEAFTTVVAAVPEHREALLGKAITLSHTGSMPTRSPCSTRWSASGRGTRARPSTGAPGTATASAMSLLPTPTWPRRASVCRWTPRSTS